MLSARLHNIYLQVFRPTLWNQCGSRKLVAKQCWMTDLREHWFLNKMPCPGKIEYGEKGQRNFQAITWQWISRDAKRAVAQNSHQCQWEDRLETVHNIE